MDRFAFAAADACSREFPSWINAAPTTYEKSFIHRSREEKEEEAGDSN
jgi:hypothetical protein